MVIILPVLLKRQMSGYGMQANGWMKVQLPSFLTSEFDGDKWSTSRSNSSSPGEKSPRYPSISTLGGPQNRPRRLEK